VKVALAGLAIERIVLGLLARAAPRATTQLLGAGHLRRGDIPRPSAVAATVLTGSYMLVGAVKLARDLDQSTGMAR
jgi:hypothetical protein